MIYFKHSELTNDYHVSLKTVHNWIDAAKQGKLNLQLREQNGRTYVANTPSNIIELEKLANRGKKYRNTLHHKVVTPKAEFYKLYNKRQILDIISNLNIHNEIPRQYNYFDGGANNWDDWLKRLKNDSTSNLLKSTIKLIQDNLNLLDQLLGEGTKVNVIDVGVGNAAPVQGLLQHLVEEGRLHRYIALDISESMLKIAGNNIDKWFGDKVKFEGHIRDISYERFDDLLMEDMLGGEPENIVNLVLLLGATPANFRNPMDVLRTVYGSMSAHDLLIYTDKSDSENSRRYFDFGPQTGIVKLSPSHSFILGLLNIDESLYSAEMGFNDQTRMRYIRIRFNTAVTVKFQFAGGERNVSFEKGDTILLLRVWHQTVLGRISEFQEIGFTLLHADVTRDREYLLTISGLSRDAKSA